MPDSAVLLRGDMSLYVTPLTTISAVADVPPLDAVPPVADWDTVADGLLTEDGVTLSHTETIEDEMVLNETVAIDDYRTAEEWMLNVTVKSWQAEILQLAMNNNRQVPDVAAASGTVGYIRIPMRKGPSVHKMTLAVRINDAPYRIDPVANVTPTPVMSQITFLRCSQRDGFESNLGPKQQGAMVSLNFKGLIHDTLDEVGYIDLMNVEATV